MRGGIRSTSFKKGQIGSNVALKSAGAPFTPPKHCLVDSLKMGEAN
jgi:hypothetical protein